MIKTRSIVCLVVASAFLIGCSSTGRIGSVESGSLAPQSQSLELYMKTCDAKHTIETSEEGSATVIVTVKSSRGSDDDCGDTLLVPLAEPLGDRVVIDGDTDEPIPIDPP